MFSLICDMDCAHDPTDYFVTAFVLREFYGDEATGATLAPDAVQFSGISYETTGF